MSRRHRVRFLEAGERWVCNARFCKFTSPHLRVAIHHVTTANSLRKEGTLSPVEESVSATVAG